MIENTEERSPAEEYFDGQQRARTANRVKFESDVGDFLFAHEALVSAIALCLKRFGGKKWPDDLDKEIAEKTAQVAQLSMHFMHGVDLCEIAIAEGLCGQAAALMRQQMEIIGAIDEVWEGKHVPKRTPNIGSLSNELKSQYGGLSELTHAAVPDHLHQLLTDVRGDLVGAAITPLYQPDLALFLYPTFPIWLAIREGTATEGGFPSNFCLHSLWDAFRWPQRGQTGRPNRLRRRFAGF